MNENKNIIDRIANGKIPIKTTENLVANINAIVIHEIPLIVNVMKKLSLNPNAFFTVIMFLLNWILVYYILIS